MVGSGYGTNFYLPFRPQTILIKRWGTPMAALLTCSWLDRASKQNENGRNHRGKYVDKAKNMQVKMSNDY